MLERKINMDSTNVGLKPITITFFKALSMQGKELYSMFQEAMKGYVLMGHPVRLIEQKVYKAMPSIIACLDSDVVIFDGSIEDGCEQYRAASELMKCLDHILIVSRTPLPVNFEGMRKGGAPGIIKTGESEYNERMTNKDIIEWIIHTLEHSSMELPRRLKMNLRAEDYQKNMNMVTNVEAKMILDSIKRIDKEDGVFVSYLSRYSKFYQGEHPEEPFVEDLFESICEINHVSKSEILYFPPGKISLELMTAQRRFEIASITEKFIGVCKAFWIYETPDYDSSWWVYGEKMSLIHIYGQTMEKCPDIYVAKPVRDENGKWKFHLQKYLSIQEKEEFLPRLTPYQQREVERLYINSNPETSGYEQVEKMRKLASMPDFLLKLQLKLEAPFVAQKLNMVLNGLESDEMGEHEKKEAMNQIKNIDLMVESVRSYVYTKEFWEKHIIECPVCRDAAKKQMDTEKYMYFIEGYFHQVAQSDYQEIVKSVKQGNICNVKLPCGHTVSVKHNGVYYRWWTVKSDVPTGPDGKLLEDVDLISFC